MSKKFEGQGPLERLASHIKQTVGDENIISYKFITEENKECCVGCGRPSLNTKLVIKTEKGKEYKIPVDGCCYAQFEGELTHLSIMQNLDKRVRESV